MAGHLKSTTEEKMGSSNGEIQLRNSERITWTTCPLKWKWAYIDHLRSSEVSPALRFGTLVHLAMETYYRKGTKRGPHPAVTFERIYEEQQADLYKQGVRDEEGEWHELGELGVTLLEEYIDHYGEDDRWYVVATEAPFRVQTADRETGLEFTFVGVVDGVWADRQSANKLSKMKKYVVDHKTTKDDPTKKDEDLMLDEQSGSYWSYGVDYYRETGVLGPDVKLSGMIFNFLRKGKPDERPTNSLGQALNKPTKDVLWEYAQNNVPRIMDYKKSQVTVDKLMELIGSKAAQLGEVSLKQPVPLFHRAISLRDETDGESVRQRTEQQARLMHYMRTGRLPVYKVPGTLHNPHCKWCEFKAMCELHEVKADWEGFRDQVYTTWDPYAQHEIQNERE